MSESSAVVSFSATGMKPPRRRDVTTDDDITDIRLGLLSSGFQPRPMKGKKGLPGWSKGSVTEEMIKGWLIEPATAYAKDTAIRCDNVDAIDCDIEDEGLATQISEIMPANDFLRIGQFPKFALFFRGDKPNTAGTGKWVDEAGGKYEVEIKAGPSCLINVHGIHEDTRLPYTWPSRSILDAKLSDLPIITPEEVADVIAQCVEIFEAAGLRRITTPKQNGGSGYDRVHDLRSDMVFECADGISRTVSEIKLVLQSGVNDVRVCCAPIREGATNPTAGAFYLSATDTVQLTDFSDSTNHYVDGEAELDALTSAVANEIPITRMKVGLVSDTDGQQPGARSADTADDDDSKAENAEEDGAASFRFRSAVDVMNSAGPVAWLIKDLLECDTFAEVFGPPKSYKSFLALDIALSIATGTKWQGHEVKQQGLVVYICGEGHGGIGRRIKAWCQEHGLQPDNLIISTMAAQLSDAEQVQMVLKQIIEAVNKTGLEPVLIIIDTLARNFGGDENTAKDMSSFISHIDTMRKPFDASALLIHHSGHGNEERSRGSSALAGALDARYQLKIEGGLGEVMLEPIFMKDAPVPDAMTFSIKSVALDGLVSDEGEPVTSLVLVNSNNQRALATAAFFKKHRKLKAGSRKQYVPLLLANIGNHPGASNADYAEAVGMNKSTIGTTVKLLIDAKLVDKDRKLTSTGHDALGFLDPAAALALTLEDVDPDDDE